MKKKNRFIIAWFAVILLTLLAAGGWFVLGRNNSRRIVEETWEGYKVCFIAPEGRVMRLRENDTVSEGQAYALLRAVWMKDKETFDRVYLWTERHLSRLDKTGDHLLAWRWKGGEVLDGMPASDADIDYALALVFAEAVWPAGPPEGLPDYGKKARAVLEDVLRFETYRIASGRLYFSPWILGPGEVAGGGYPVNPSYYAPAHFRIFFEVTGDPRWKELVATTYFVLGKLRTSFGGRPGVGLFPDWCRVNDREEFFSLPGKSADFGWEAVRIPLRVVLDGLWFGSPAAADILRDSVGGFAERRYRQQGKVFCEYTYEGRAVKEYENPLFYASYYCATRAMATGVSRAFLEKTRSYLFQNTAGWVYGEDYDYFVNSLSWMADGVAGGIVRNLYGKGGKNDKN